MKIYYGVINKNIDVTHICMNTLMKNNVITIPSGDSNRTSYFTDPLYGIHKKIFIEHNEITEYNEDLQIRINLTTNTITTKNMNVDAIITTIHSNLKINYGDLNDELSEQKMAVRYLTGDEKVLEIGGNIGRNSLIIASMLNHTDFVSLESNPYIAQQLIENRNLNNLQFHIENSALSNRKLIQRHWDTKPSDVLEPGYIWVNTITLQELHTKYNIVFDTLVLDCEGAFYYILMDMPEILDNIKLIIMENDYWDISHKMYIDSVLEKNNFNLEYSEQGGWGPCFPNFFEVWKR